MRVNIVTLRGLVQMFLTLKKKGRKIFLLLLQFGAMASLFVVMFDKEAVFIFKDFVDRLQLDMDMQISLMRLLLPVRMLLHSPSLYAIIFLLTPIFVLASSIYLRASISTEPFVYEESDVQSKTYDIISYVEQKNCSYLKTMRLLF